MLTSTRGLMAALLIAGSALAATPALADEADAPSDFTISGNVQGVTDYRFRGLSLSAGDFALQGSINVNHSSGLYVGTWASSLEQDGADTYGNAEVDFYAGWTGSVASGLTADVGLLYYMYPNGTGAAPGNVWEPYASLSAAIGPATAKVGLAYAWDQDSLGGDDNLYVYTDLSAGIPNTPLSVSGHLGYTDGALSPKRLTLQSNGGGFDWNIGASFNITPKLSLGATYVGVEGNSIDSFSNDAVVGTLKLSF